MQALDKTDMCGEGLVITAPSAAQATELARMALVGRLVGGITHEIGNPLTSIANALFLLRTDPEQNTTESRFLGLIQGEIEKLARITGVMRLFSSAAPPAEQDRALGVVTEDLRLVLATRLRRRATELVCPEACISLSLEPVCWEIRLALVPIVLAWVDRTQEQDLVRVEGVSEGGTLRVQVQAGRSRLQPDEVTYLQTGETTPALTWVGIQTGLRLTRDLVCQRGGSLECDAEGGRVVLCLPVGDGKEHPARAQSPKTRTAR